MLETIFSNADSISLNLETSEILTALVVSLVLGTVISLVYMFTNDRMYLSKSFAHTLVILPMLVAVIILLVGSDVARAFSIAGVFALIRFRSVPGDSKDITQVLFAMAVGLASGLGYVALATIVTVLVCMLFVVMHLTGFAGMKVPTKVLRITIPENLNYQGAFDDLFAENTKVCTLERVRTTNMGSMFELTYNVVFKDGVDEKAFIDELRCRNGNLNIILSRMENIPVL